MYSFPRELKINNGNDFVNIFKDRQKVYGHLITIFYRKNLNVHSRLGMIISKKINKHSNKRNYMKRVLRELFRCNQFLWNNYDVVIRVNKLFTCNDYPLIKEEFIKITDKLSKIK